MQLQLNVRRAAFVACVIGLLIPSASTTLLAQSDEEEKSDEVTIERDPLMVKEPDEYQFRFHLAPQRKADLIAPKSGTINQINSTAGNSVRAQFTLATLDDTREKLKAAIAAARLEAAKAKQPSDAEPASVLAAQRQLAEAEYELAKFELAQTEVFVPFDGKVDQVLLTQGAYVIAGTVIATVIDESTLTVQLPLERKEISEGDTIEIQVESEKVRAKVTNISGIPEKWDALRDLASSVAMVTLEVANSGDKYHAGQTVYSPLIPRHRVAEVDLDAVSNSSQGGRQVQVIREQTIRNIEVETLGQVGQDRIFVSGLFLDGDEIVTSSSIELKEGTLVQSIFDSQDVRKGKTGTRSPSSNRINSRQQEF